MFFRGQNTSLCLVIVGLITVHTIGVNHPHHWCLLSAQCVRGALCISKEWYCNLIMLHPQYGSKGAILIRYVINMAMTS